MGSSEVFCLCCHFGLSHKEHLVQDSILETKEEQNQMHRTRLCTSSESLLLFKGGGT